MDIPEISTDWAKAEVFSAKIALLLSVLTFVATLGFWQLGKSATAKDFVWPLLLSGIALATISAGLYFANKPRIAQFEAAYKADPRTFVNAETERTAKSQNDLALVFRVLPIVVILAALLIVFVRAPFWRSIGITVIALMSVLMFIDANTNARNTAYHQRLLSEK